MSASYPAELSFPEDEESRPAGPGERGCVAIWKSWSIHHDIGSTCGQDAPFFLGSVPLCAHHFKQVIEHANELRLEGPRHALEKIWQARLDADRELEERKRLLAESKGIVYYLLRPADAMIKIGTTSHPGTRITNLRREHGLLLLLLAHAGGRERELETHKRFAALRADRSEWFSARPPLTDWIASERNRTKYQRTRVAGVLTLYEARKVCRLLRDGQLEKIRAMDCAKTLAVAGAKPRRRSS